MPLIIGMTGSIATGKSTVCDYLVKNGAVHCDADKLVHRMYEPDKPAFERIVEAFGLDIIGENGFIDRKILGTKVFGKPEKMSDLTTAIGDIQAEVRGVMENWRTSLRKDDIGLMEAVNFIDAGYGQYSDFTWLFAVEKKIAKKRLMNRNKLNSEAAEQRLTSQKHWKDRAPAADIVTHNNGSEKDLIEKIEYETSRVFELWQAGNLPQSKYVNWWKSRGN
jgi:dephospho-CoA kinase